MAFRKEIKYKATRPGCWLCTSHALSSRGYPFYHYQGVQRQLSRVMYVLHLHLSLEDIKGKVIRHTCDNKKCINPDHLLLGTQRDNMNDMLERGRSNREERNGMSKLNKKAVREVKLLLSKGVSQKEVAKRFNIDPSTVSNVNAGKTWRRVFV